MTQPDTHGNLITSAQLRKVDFIEGRVSDLVTTATNNNNNKKHISDRITYDRLWASLV